MSTAGSLRSAGEGLANAVVTFGRRARRTSPGPTLLRVLAGLAALAGMGLAIPREVPFSTTIAVALPMAAGVTLFPRTRWVGVVLLVAVVAWLVNTIAFATEPLQAWRVGALAAALYVAHAAAALAAVIPYDSVVAAGVLARWAARTTLVVVVGVGFGLALMAVLSQLRSVQSAVGAVAGALVAAGLAGLLAWQLHRRA